MGLIRQAPHTGVSAGAVLDLADVAQEAARIVASAKLEAERILQEANAERDALVSNAYDIGHQMGFQKGFEEGKDRGHAEGFEQTMNELREGFSLLDASWNEALASFRDLRATMLEEAQTDLVVLATEVAERVTKRYVELDENVAAAQLREAIGLVLDRTKLAIEVHPEDEQACREVLPKLMAEVHPDDHARLITSSELRRGSVVIRTPRGFIDASIDTQVRRIVQALLRDRQRLIDEVENQDIEAFASFNGAGGAQQYDMSELTAESDACDVARPTQPDPRFLHDESVVPEEPSGEEAERTRTNDDQAPTADDARPDADADPAASPEPAESPAPEGPANRDPLSDQTEATDRPPKIDEPDEIEETGPNETDSDEPDTGEGPTTS